MLKWFGVVLLLGTAAPVMADCLDVVSYTHLDVYKRQVSR